MRRSSIFTAFMLPMVVAAVVLSPLAGAAQPEVTVAPFLQNVQLGSERAKDLAIIYGNSSGQTKNFILSVADFGSLDQSGGVAFVGPAFSRLLEQHKLSTWLNLSQNSFTLAPHQQKAIKATITNASAMAPGGHYAAVVATVITPDASGANRVSVKQKVSSLVFVTKTGGEKYDLRLEKITKNGSLLKLPTQAGISVKATGNTHVVPRGIVYLRDSSGRVLAKGVINQESGYVLPGTSRVFSIDLHKLQAAKFWQTSYDLQADYRYDGLDRYASRTEHLTVISPWLPITFAVLFGVSYLGLRYLRKSRAR